MRKPALASCEGNKYFILGVIAKNTSRSNMFLVRNKIKSLTLAFIIIHVCSTRSYYKRCDCGVSNSVSNGRRAHERIVGGHDYDSHKYPWLAALLLNGTFLCGGSIISELYVLSAAHCLNNRYDQSTLKVILGEHNRCKNDVRTTIFSVSKVTKHRKFNPNNYFADVMILKLSMAVTFNKFVKPICLPKFDITQNVVSKYNRKIAKVIGWGKKHPISKNSSCIPQELQVPILEDRQCSKYSKYSLFCAGYLEGGQDSCQGDSGGPLMILTRRNKFEIIGIVSNGIGCGLQNHPGLYTDILQYLPWIWKQTDGSIYCV